MTKHVGHQPNQTEPSVPLTWGRPHEPVFSIELFPGQNCRSFRTTISKENVGLPLPLMLRLIPSTVTFSLVLTAASYQSTIDMSKPLQSILSHLIFYLCNSYYPAKVSCLILSRKVLKHIHLNNLISTTFILLACFLVAEHSVTYNMAGLIARWVGPYLIFLISQHVACWNSLMVCPFLLFRSTSWTHVIFFLQVHFRGYPANILTPCEGEDSVKWSFINSLKEVRYNCLLIVFPFYFSGT